MRACSFGPTDACSAFRTSSAWDTCALRVCTLRIGGAASLCRAVLPAVLRGAQWGCARGRGDEEGTTQGGGTNRVSGRGPHADGTGIHAARSVRHPCPAALCSATPRAADRSAREPHKCDGQLTAQAAQGAGDAGTYESRCEWIICASCSTDWGVPGNFCPILYTNILRAEFEALAVAGRNEAHSSSSDARVIQCRCSSVRWLSGVMPSMCSVRPVSSTRCERRPTRVVQSTAGRGR